MDKPAAANLDWLQATNVVRRGCFVSRSIIGACVMVCLGAVAGVNAASPSVMSADPAPGSVSQLTQIDVTFDVPVAGVVAGDFLVNGAPASAVTGSGNSYTYAFTQPPEGPVSVNWEANHGITDLSGTRLDELAASASWQYTLSDLVPPTVRAATPPAGLAVSQLGQIEVSFSEPVIGVDAGDLLLNGQAATNVTGVGPYLFYFANPPPGMVTVSWLPGHGIRDAALAANPLNPSGWAYDLDPAAVSGDVVLNEILAENRVGIVDEDGQHEDWIELRNRGAVPVRLVGWSLTDDPDFLRKWVFPDVTINAGQYLLIYASAKDRRSTLPGARLHTNFRLNPTGDYLALYNAELPPRMVSEFGPGYPEQRGDISYGRSTNGSLVHFPTPTPGGPNSGGLMFGGVVMGPRASVASGLFDQPFQLHLSTPTVGASIFYTLDGSSPTEASLSYAGPIDIAGTASKAVVMVRAAAFKTGLLSSAVTTHSYIFPQHVLTQPAQPTGFPVTWVSQGKLNTSGDYQMDPDVVNNPAYTALAREGLTSLPTLSIVTHVDRLFGATDGVYVRRDDQNQQPVHAELILADGSDGFSIDCGLEIQGGSSTTDQGSDWKSKNLSMRLLFKGEFGPNELSYQVFPDSPVDQFDTLVVDAGLNLTWNHMTDAAQRTQAQYVRDQYMSDLQNGAGGKAPHGRFVHVYLNGLYWGMHNMHERPDDSFAAEYFGGNKSDYDVIKHRVGTVVSGDANAFNTMFTLARSGLANNAAYEGLQEYLDVPWFIDYMIINLWAGNTDWSHQNWYATRRRAAGAGYRFISWDAEHVLKSANEASGMTKSDPSSPTEMFQLLRANPEFRLLFADRVQKHFFNGGLFYVDTNAPNYNPARPDRNVAAANYMKRIDEIDPAIVTESARWGDTARATPPYTRNVEWLQELNGLLYITNTASHNVSFFPLRSGVVLSQFRSAGLYPSLAAPVYSSNGGRVAAGQSVYITNAAAVGTVYYTTNGSDPRVFGSGAVSPQALVHVAGTGLVLSESTLVRARTQNGAVWSALAEATFTVGTLSLPLRITEIMYHPTEGEAFSFVELINAGPVTLDISSYAVEGIGLTFSPGTILAAGGRMVLASSANTNAFFQRYPSVSVGAFFNGSLAQNGERLALRDGTGRLFLSVDYRDNNGWPLEADGGGYSLEIIDVDGNPDSAANWRRSQNIGGSPGLPPGGMIFPTVVINEVAAENLTTVPNDVTFPDWIELFNTSGEAVDLQGWSLSDDNVPRKFVLPAGTVLGAGEYLTLWCDTNGGPGLHTGFALSKNGETVALYDRNTNRVDVIAFGVQISDATLGRVANNWVLTSPTPGALNMAVALAPPTQLSLNEWMANPAPGEDDYFELFNRSAAAPVSLQNIYAGSSNALFQLKALSFIAPQSHLLIRADNNPGPDHVDFRLPASGSSIVLYDETGTQLDRITYGAQLEGVSEGRLPDGAAGIVVFAGSASPGSTNFVQNYTGPRLNELSALNVGGTSNSIGRFADWIELYNPAASAFDLSGLGLNDRPTKDSRWLFPPGTSIPALGYLVVWFDAMRPASSVLEPDLNAGRGLDSDGGSVNLFNRSGQIVDSVGYGFQIQDRTVGLVSGSWRLLAQGTPAAANSGPALLGAQTVLRINEWLAGSALAEDWFEIFNPLSAAVDLTALQLTDDLSISGARKTRLPALSFIGPRGYVQVIADGDAAANANHASFSLESAGGSIRLYAADLRVIDSIYYGAQSDDVSEGRLPDGSSSIVGFTEPTPGQPNSLAPGPPIIITSPQSQYVKEGTNVVFDTEAIGVGQVYYQWRLQGQDIMGATSATLSLTNVQSEHQGPYTAVATNSYGAVTSGVAVLTVEVRPSIIAQPQSQTIFVGSNVTFTVRTRGTLPIGYRWRRNNAPFAHFILNQHVSSITLSNVQPAQAGNFSVVVTNALNVTPGLLSVTAVLTVGFDLDQDGMSDAWEALYGFDSTNPGDGSEDADGDGFSNKAEFEAGTNPRQVNSYLRIETVDRLVPDRLRMTFFAVSNRSYSVLAGQPGGNDSWVSVFQVDPALTNRLLSVTNTVPVGLNERYYHLVTPRAP